VEDLGWFFAVFTHASLVWSHRNGVLPGPRIQNRSQNRVSGLPDGDNCVFLRSLVLNQYYAICIRTDRRTDARTDTPSVAKSRCVTAERDKMVKLEPAGCDLLEAAACRVAHLSLRYNQISDAGAEHLGRCLGNVTSQNTHLTTLNLAGNRISDVGARHIANVSCTDHMAAWRS